MSQKAKFLLKQGVPWTKEGTSSARLLVNGGVTYSSSSSSNSNGSAADPTPRVRGLLSEHLQRRSAIESILAPNITLSAFRSSTSRDNLTISSLLALSSCRCRFIRRDNTLAFPFIVFRNSSKRAANADSKLAIWLTAALSAALLLVTAADNSCSSRSHWGQRPQYLVRTCREHCDS